MKIKNKEHNPTQKKIVSSNISFISVHAQFGRRKQLAATIIRQLGTTLNMIFCVTEHDIQCNFLPSEEDVNVQTTNSTFSGKRNEMYSIQLQHCVIPHQQVTLNVMLSVVVYNIGTPLGSATRRIYLRFDQFFGSPKHKYQLLWLFPGMHGPRNNLL